MSPKPSYIGELKELYENHKGKELETVLGVSVRSIQNYIKEERKPGADFVKKVHETFANYKKGLGLIPIPKTEDQENLTQTVKNLSETNLMNTENIRDLIMILKVKFGITNVSAPPTENGTGIIPIEDKKKAAK